MDTPFKLKVIFNNYGTDKEENLKVYSNIQEINFQDKNSTIKIKEYTPFKLSIENEGHKLYFDLFDLISDNRLQYDNKGHKYLENNKVTIVNSSESINSVIVPGYYHLKIVGEEVFHTVIEIVPKDFGDAEWKLLLDELLLENEALVKSLRNKTNSQLINTKTFNSDFISKLNYINSNYYSLINALNLIKENPKSVLAKEYRWIDKNMSPPTDELTISMHMKKPNKSDFLYSPKRKLQYDNNDNRWLKQSLFSLTKFLVKLIDDGKSEINKLSDEKLTLKYNHEKELIESNITELEKSLNNVHQLLYRVNIITKESWFKEVTISKRNYISHSLMHDNKYRTVYKWINDILNKENVIIYNSTLQYSWKRTDQLYELWSFMKIIKILLNDNYEIDEEWLQNKDLIEGNISEGSNFKLIKENIILSIYYDSEIAKDSKNTNLQNPLFTLEEKNKPDIRIDIYIDNYFVQSLPIEVKYRKLNKITHKTEGNIKQLKYYTSFKSLHQISILPERLKKGLKAVNELLVIYPNGGKEKKTSTVEKLFQELGLVFIELSPNKGLPELEKKMKEVIKSASENYQDYKKMFN